MTIEFTAREKASAEIYLSYCEGLAARLSEGNDNNEVATPPYGKHKWYSFIQTSSGGVKITVNDELVSGFIALAKNTVTRFEPWLTGLKGLVPLFKGTLEEIQKACAVFFKKYTPTYSYRVVEFSAPWLEGEKGRAVLSLEDDTTCFHVVSIRATPVNDDGHYGAIIRKLALSDRAKVISRIDFSTAESAVDAMYEIK